LAAKKSLVGEPTALIPPAGGEKTRKEGELTLLTRSANRHRPAAFDIAEKGLLAPKHSIIGQGLYRGRGRGFAGRIMGRPKSEIQRKTKFAAEGGSIRARKSVGRPRSRGVRSGEGLPRKKGFSGEPIWEEKSGLVPFFLTARRKE